VIEPYEIHAGAPTSPVVLHVPHASRRLTELARGSIVLDDAALAAELDHMTDSHTDLIAAGAAHAAALTPWRFVNRYSRLVVDPERFPDDREEMLAVGMGAVYTATSDGRALRVPDPPEAPALLRQHFEPYAAGMTEVVADRLAVTGRVVIIDVHSYPRTRLPYELHHGPRPTICLGTDATHTPAWLLAAARGAFAQCGDVELDTPFAGCYVPLRYHGRDAAVSALMVEMRRDSYMREPGGPPTDGAARVTAALARLVDAVT
jgi:N-formylglutamate amidohydrolase